MPDSEYRIRTRGYTTAILRNFTTKELLHELRDRGVIEGAKIISIAPAYRDINALKGKLT